MRKYLTIYFFVALIIIALGTFLTRSFYIKSGTTLPPKVITYTSASRDTVTIFFGGDTMLGDAAMPLISEKGYKEPLRDISYLPESADVAIVNLEAPVTTQGEPVSKDKARILRQHPDAMTALAQAGIDIFILANNHILDYGPIGLDDTINATEEHNLTGIGAGLNEQKARQGIIIQIKTAETNLPLLKIGLLAYMELYRKYVEKYKFFAAPNSPGVATLSEDTLRVDIKAMRPLVDVLIISPHWGDDYKPIRQLQRHFGRRAIDLGADAVIGHHSHSHQQIESYRGSPIIYSLGNFVFGSQGKIKYEAFPGIKRKFCCGMPVIVHINPISKKIKMIEFIPILTQNRVVKFVPRRLGTDETRTLLEQLQRDSDNNIDFEIINSADGPRGLWRFDLAGLE